MWLFTTVWHYTVNKSKTSVSSKTYNAIIDDKLKWSEHIKHISNKVSKGIGIINKAKKYMNRKGLIKLYCALVYPYLIYCIEVWGNASNYVQCFLHF